MKFSALLFLITPLLGGLGCAATSPSADAAVALSARAFAARQSACVPQFPDQAGWFGGDAAYSVPLPIDEDRVSLWLFGDSFVQRPDTPKERSYPFVHNTMGLSRCADDGTWTLESFWRHDSSGAPHAFFAPDPESDWVASASRAGSTPPYYWPFGGFVVHDALFIGLLRVEHSEPRGAFNLPFQLAGMDLARIENYRDDPAQWRIQLSILSDHRDAFPGSAFALTASHLNAFAFFDRGDGRSPRMLSRIDLDALKTWRPDVSDALETLSIDRRWRIGFEPDNALILMADDASEMSVHYDVDAKMWIAIYSPLTRALERPDNTRAGTPILIRTAPELAGPWSDPLNLFTIPETIPLEGHSVDDSLFCYAGKAHPQFAKEAELVVTYVCNLFAALPDSESEVLDRLRTSTQLYRPRVTTLKFAPARK
jgi:hypothetical protein